MRVSSVFRSIARFSCPLTDRNGVQNWACGRHNFASGAIAGVRCTMVCRRGRGYCHGGLALRFRFTAPVVVIHAAMTRSSMFRGRGPMVNMPPQVGSTPKKYVDDLQQKIIRSKNIFVFRPNQVSHTPKSYYLVVVRIQINAKELHETQPMAMFDVKSKIMCLSDSIRTPGLAIFHGR